MFLLDYLPRLAEGLWLSLSVALLSLLLSCAIGLLAALAKLSHHKWLNIPATIYTMVVRGVPDLVMMFLIFYGGQMMLNQVGNYFGWDYIDVDAFYAGVITLSFIFGAFMTETFRAAIVAVDKNQLEAAHAFGMSPIRVFISVLVPQMLLHALPGFTNNWLVLLKATAILSVIGLNDMVFIANAASRSTHQPFVFFLLISVVYLLLTWLSIRVIRQVENHYHLQHQV